MGADETNQTRAFPDPYGRLLEEFADQIGEKGTSYGQPSRSVREEIVRCVWFGGHFAGEDLTVDDGRRLEVISPGWWNVEGGPDFIRAELLLEGAGRVVGDVEVHTLASGWYSHGHHQQPDYNGVVLHVAMWNDRDEPAVQTEDGTRVPQLTLSKAVDEDLEELVEIMDVEGEPSEQEWPITEGKYCGQAYRAGEIDSRWLGRMLDAAGDHRLLTRAAVIGELLENHPREQLLYERLAEALGYKNNRMPFLQLAGLLPMATLRRAVDLEARAEQKSRVLEAAFLTAGGFLEGAGDEDADPETMAYCARLREDWDAMDPATAPVKLSPHHWNLAGTRPVNYPGRRLTALALLCAAHLHSGLFNHFLLLVNTSRPEGRQRADAALRNALVARREEAEQAPGSGRRGACDQHPGGRSAADAAGARAGGRRPRPRGLAAAALGRDAAPAGQRHHAPHGAHRIRDQAGGPEGRQLRAPPAGPAPTIPRLLPHGRVPDLRPLSGAPRGQVPGSGMSAGT